jgi:branched-chain amino acid transport system ATP-binding protein
MPLLEVRGLRARYGGIRALMGIDLDVDKGDVVSLLGANGAGKSTLMAAITGVMSRGVEGSIRLDGKEILGLGADKVVREGVALSPEGRQLFGDLTVAENLKMGAYTRRDSAGIQADWDRVLHIFPRVKERLSQLASTLSGGEQQMVAIGRALMSRPRLLLLDEPSLGLSPRFVQDIMKLIRQINQQGTTVLLVEQNVRQALHISNRAYVLEKGAIQMSGEAATVARDPRVLSAYLGAD